MWGSGEGPSAFGLRSESGKEAAQMESCSGTVSCGGHWPPVAI